ncbi:carbamoyl phosphate synthase small subunit [Oceanobacillus profundus]|uniref:Carbamoyl phosphate synthase small chain n=1 Tax=Oceanobacillus profundus TaxID=372463 RepID=A0A417YLC6_9BACI|nr:carbamoyl phosphate synthase small subunit [Oceanobacillus profundus]RHW34297.1 carbamoyl phosphate synthase small subunit [Oceanobacillus profundus]
MTKGYLILETGEEFVGDWIGNEQEVSGEVVFNTSMTGYQEMMTDPSYAGQLLTFCYPMIGNYGMNAYDDESQGLAISAVIVSDMCEEPSHYQAMTSFSERLKAASIPGLMNVDTRALVGVIRKNKTVNGKIISEKQKNAHEMNWEAPDWLAVIEQVSVKKPISYGSGQHHIVLVDYGYKKSILDQLLALGCKVTIVPFDTPFEKIKEFEPDGVLLSNGPGDPLALARYFPDIKRITKNFPTLGICLGHQLLALAYGGKTKKMQYGHRGGNHPVKDMQTGKVWMTSQNHGYVVEKDSLSKQNFDIWFQNVNDHSLEGIKHRQLPVQSVQFHPEAHPGPSDTAYIFLEFIQQAAANRQKGAIIYAEA